MTKVEELRERLVNAELDSGSVGTEKEATEVVDSLVSAARAEGTEQERERIRKTHLMGIGVVDGIDYVLVPVSVLAPKEPDDGNA